mmetsp:Transcript_22625/g.33080  ORF Transcript_22625/g.33080 Transcript_22625/m.33080 type:complete len:308 (-) Transcript_22625:212-1135(-)
MNKRNTAVKRIHADVKELATHLSPRYHAAPLEDNIFEWHFTIRGPPDTDFEGGIYHGRILLSPEYPFKPPNIIFLTKNGRFEVGTKICLSISAYHPEHWQPAWGVRTMLEAIISFLPSEGGGAIGALDWTPAERKKLAAESHSYCCPVCGPVDKLIELPESTDEVRDDAMQEQLKQLHIHGLEEGSTSHSQELCGTDSKVCTTNSTTANSDSTKDVSSPISEQEGQQNVSVPSAEETLTSTTAADNAVAASSNSSSSAPATVQHPEASNSERDIVDDIIFYALVFLGLAITYLVVKKMKSSSGWNDL